MKVDLYFMNGDHVIIDNVTDSQVDCIENMFTTTYDHEEEYEQVNEFTPVKMLVREETFKVVREFRNRFY